MSAERPHHDNSGVLFQNRNKKHPNAPAMTGEATVDGKRYRVAAWEKASRQDGRTFWSVAFSVPQTPETTTPTHTPTPSRP